MKKRIKIKWNNVITAVLLIDIIRILGTLTFNMTAGLTLIGFISLMIEMLSITALTSEVR